MPKPTVDPRFHAFRDAVAANLEAAAEMLAQDAVVLRLRNELGETAMHFFAVEGFPGEVVWLIENGSEVDTQNKFKQTPLMEVAGMGRLEMCQLLVSLGASFGYVSSRGESVLSAAASSDEAEVVKYLLALIPTEIDINSFFDNVEAEMTLRHSPKSAELLTRRGLKKRWP
ncbi:MAG TPA: ankyrin repeat domain-containing protein [Chthoniobacter sp.]|jgi:ankyrin repeat protein